MNYSIPKNYQIRLANPTDNFMLKKFLEAVPEGGKITFQPRYKFGDILGTLQIRRPGTFCLVAFFGNQETPVGVVFGYPHLSNFGNKSVRAVMLANLSVHPDYRRQGIGTALLKEAIEYSKEKYGLENLVHYCYVQEGNLASETTCARANGTLTGRYLIVSPTRTISSTRLKTTLTYQIREATEIDYPAIVGNINQFYAGYNFYEPQTEESIRRWLEPREIEGKYQTFTNYYVAMDNEGEIQAGIGVFYGTKLYDLEIIKLPQVVKLLNRIFKIVPTDKMLGALPVSRFWYKPGQFEAARELWKQVRKLESSRGKLLLSNFDTEGGLASVLMSRGLAPSSKIQLVLFDSSDSTYRSSKGRLASYEM